MTHWFGGELSDWPWLPPPSTTTIRAVGSRLRATSAPWYGVAGSSVPCSMRIGGSFDPSMRIGCARPFAGQNAHDALNQVFAHVSNGAVLFALIMSEFQVAQLRGQFTSLHSTAL